MLKDAKNAELIAKFLDYIETEKTKDAFLYIVGLSAALTDFDCHPQPKGHNGPVFDFRFYKKDSSEQPFAFIPNKRWLLFYFRTSAVGSGRYSLMTLRSQFDSVNENNSGEWTVELRCIYDVRRLWKVLAIH